MAVFRDQSDLSPGSHLWGSIQNSLDSTRFFILLACPESAASHWVNKEVEHWCATKGTEQLIIVLTGGELIWDASGGDFNELSTALPPALRGRFSEEPLYVDMRWGRDTPDLSLRLSTFRGGVATIAAPIRGTTPAALEGDDIRQHRRVRLLARSAVAGLVVLGVATSAAAVVAVNNKHRADRRTREAVSRQVGLFALDQQIGDVDTAMLLSIAAARLNPDAGPERFQTGRALIGKYSRLQSLLYTNSDHTLSTIRSLAIAPNGGHAAAIEWNADGDPELLVWKLTAVGPAALVPTRTAIPAELLSNGAHPLARYAPDGTLLVGSPTTLSRLNDSGEFEPTLLTIDIDPHGHRAVVRDGTAITITDLPTWSTVGTITDVPAATVLDLDAQHLVAAGPDSVQLFAAADGVLLAEGALLAAGASPSGDTGAGQVAGPRAVGAGPNDEVAMLVLTADNMLRPFHRTGDALVADAPIAIATPLGEPQAIVVAASGQLAVIVGSAASVTVALDGRGTLGSDVRSSGVVAIDPSGRYVAVGGERLVVWDLAGGERPLSIPTEVSTLSWSNTCADATATCRLVSGGQSIVVWEPATGRQVTLAADSNAQAVSISADGMTIVTAGWGSQVARWTMQPPIDAGGRTTVIGAGGLTAYDQVSGMSARADGATTVVGDTSVATGSVDSMVFAGPTRLLTTHAGKVDLWNTVDGTDIDIASFCTGPMVAVSEAGSRFAVHDPARSSVALCDSTTGRKLAGTLIAAEYLPITALAVGDDGTVAIGGGGYVTALRPDDGGGLPGVAIEAIAGQRAAFIDSMAVHDGQIAAGIRTDDPAATFGRVLLWDTRSGSTPITFPVDSATVAGLAFIGDDGDAVVVASNDDDPASTTLQVWEVATRRRIGAGFRNDAGPIIRLAGDASSIVAVHADGVVSTWPLNRDPAQEICAIVGRGLTRQEWDAAAGGALRPYPFVDVCGGR